MYSPLQIVTALNRSEAAAAHVAEKAMLTAQLASVSSELVLETERAKRLERAKRPKRVHRLKKAQ